MTTRKSAAQVAVMAEPCQKSTHNEAIDQLYALQAIAKGLSTGLSAYMELARISAHHDVMDGLGMNKAAPCAKPRGDYVENYRLEDLADAFACLVEQQRNALDVVGGAA